MLDPVIFTEGAADKVREILVEEGNLNLKLRVYVTGGGCSGLQYGFSFEESMAEDDTVVTRNGVNMVIDPTSFQYLNGAEIDFMEDLEGSRFIIKNPNATTTCGCGSSFSI
ncbi:iron-sulfur cluster insertion protein ErpA [Ferrovum myxofaciens]|jgi:iron-sulfur cluster insertion protein|uniref:Putative iron-sulfur cluster insertion protein ErpA n=2 Tax=root TaxID=1 RepID=A0A859AC82_9PROT|nr:iron-sulfur cluster insertion protein ErpA [Ferrovum myxofaciens]KXW57772.1 iron-sulfur cluster insertion protein ErpA [Ferrovum myxofaciens]MBU6995656.1 iron-sulfur cluster insertion protein ErpA [Ferrovum myxofaciens]QKE39565.1 MAG: iron-sulfur cluster insertion protein ErpA [Ferrovum myxofaciens]QKE42162.1 MAG: iron-sulfur cluster insertion protein ErpA [Ferrovum myxofaciens]QWY74849.1 MAG: iron-sulfur cluster insertion protein ErpA [Ferrovum myxofaciens]